MEDLFSHNLKGSINPIKQARLFKRMMEVKRLNQAQFSRKYNISKAQMSKIMKRLKEPEDIQEIVSKSKLSTSLVDELFTLPEDQTRLILQNLELDNMKVEDVRRFKIEMTMIRNTLEHIAGTPDLEKLRTVDWNKLDPKILEVHKKWFIEDSEKEGIKGFDEARWRFSLLLSSSHAYKEWHEHKPKNVPFEDFVIDVVNFALATYFSSYTDLLGKEEGERLIKIYSWKAGIDVDWGCQSTYMSSSEFLHPELAHRESEKSKATKIKSLIQHLKKD